MVSSFCPVSHVITEYERVEAAVECLERGELEIFGGLMNQSHKSCRDDYEISCRIGQACFYRFEQRSFGCRLTGAGFGGCTISLVREENADEVKEILVREYYDRYLKLKNPDVYEQIQNYDDCVFLCSPEDGAGIVELKRVSADGLAV